MANNTLQRAIEALGAVEVAPGRYAYRSTTLDRFVVVPGEALALQWARFKEGYPDDSDQALPAFIVMPPGGRRRSGSLAHPQWARLRNTYRNDDRPSRRRDSLRYRLDSKPTKRWQYYDPPERKTPCNSHRNAWRRRGCAWAVCVPGLRSV